MESKNQIVTHLRNWTGDEVQRQKSWTDLSDSLDLKVSGLDVGDDDFDVDKDGRFKGRIRLLVWKNRNTAAGTSGIESRVHGVTIEGTVRPKQVDIREFVIDRESETDLLKHATLGYRQAAE